MRHRLLTALGGANKERIYDTFTGANTTALASHTIAPLNIPATSWTDDVAGLQITSNKFGATGADKYSSCAAGVADGVISVVIRFSDVSFTCGAGLVFRQSDVNNKFLLLAANNALTLYKDQAGAFTSLQTTAVTPSNNTDYTISVTLAGTSIQCAYGALASFTVTNIFNQSATRAGVYGSDNSLGAHVTGDDFRVSTL